MGVYGSVTVGAGGASPSWAKRKTVATVAHALARRLTGTHDYCDFIFETHTNLIQFEPSVHWTAAATPTPNSPAPAPHRSSARQPELEDRLILGRCRRSSELLQLCLGLCVRGNQRKWNGAARDFWLMHVRFRGVKRTLRGDIGAALAQWKGSAKKVASKKIADTKGFFFCVFKTRIGGVG